jgi:DNA-binding response OmpR family regulator
MHKVILVEDEELIRTMIRLNLEQEGLAVEWYADAESMLQQVGSGAPACDLFLLDIMLPGMSGVEALVELRGRGQTAPVLMLTAKSEVESRVTALDLGADDYLPKPFDLRELVARVGALLRRGAQSHRAEESE